MMCGRAVCEQGNLQVFFQDLPLSIQDGYERFLSSSSVSLLQYQVEVEAEAMMMEECAPKRKTTKNATGFFFLITKVFGHLKRLGFVVHRFDPR